MHDLFDNLCESKVCGQEGFFLGLKFTESELKTVRALIEKQWIERINQQYPDLTQQFHERGMEKYHELSYLIDHGSLWPKQERILPKTAVNIIRALPFFTKLESFYGPFLISDEENVGWEEIYWRLVRPNESNDVGPLHADAWFWALGHGNTPPNTKRIKVWAAIYCEIGRNGLKLVPGSHNKEWRFHGEYRDGFSKPQIDEKEEDLNVQLVHTRPGDAIVFNDKLLHGGAVNRGENTRVSIEFTMFVQN